MRVLSNALARAVVGLFKERAYIRFSSPPVVRKQEIIEYRGRMRVFGLEKFESPTYISVVNYYRDPGDMQAGNALGALAIFVEKKNLPHLLKMLRYPTVNELSKDAMLDACGALANLVAGRFQSEMRELGLAPLEMSTFSNYRDSAPEGVAFHSRQRSKYEINFDISGRKQLVVELTMGEVSLRES